MQYSIKASVEMGDGAVIPSLGPVTFVSVYPMDHKTRKDGTPFDVQNAVIKDETGEVRIAFFDRPDQSNLKNTTKLISSVKGANNRQTGVSVRVGKDGKGQPRWEMSIAKQAVITDPTEATQATPVLAVSVEPPATTPSATAQQPQAACAPACATKTADRLDDVIVLFRRCYAEAQEIVPCTRGDGGLYDGYLTATQAAAATLFIAARQENLTAGAAKRYPCCSQQEAKEISPPKT